MALRIEINLNKLLDRPAIGDYILTKETLDLYRIIMSENDICLINVESAFVIKKYRDMQALLESLNIAQGVQIIKEENFKLMYIEPGC